MDKSLTIQRVSCYYTVKDDVAGVNDMFDMCREGWGRDINILKVTSLRGREDVFPTAMRKGGDEQG